jgi:hypothetical protein
MFDKPKNEQTWTVYRQLMEWMETGIPNVQTLAIRVREAAAVSSVPLTTASPSGVGGLQAVVAARPAREIRFRKVQMMGGAVRAESIDKPGLFINYDPNWAAYLKIEEILEQAKLESTTLGGVE